MSTYERLKLKIEMDELEGTIQDDDNINLCALVLAVNRAIKNKIAHIIDDALRS